jgi:hypothetical protein
MVIAVSPYHLTTREVPAMAALLLGRRVVTMVPVPVDDAGGVGGFSAMQTAARIPTYRKFVESWSWTTPLWKREILSFAHASQNCADDMWAAAQHIEDEPGCAGLRHFLKHHEFPDPAAYLSAVAADLLKGGPDPGISLPVVAGLDRFATRHALAVARSRPTSLAQQAESRMGEAVTTIAVPVLLQATAERVLHYREVLCAELEALRGAMARLADPESGAMPTAGDAARLESAAHALADAVEARREELAMGAGDDDVRVVEGVATLTLARLPWDAAISSSVRAMDSLHAAPAGAGWGEARRPGDGRDSADARGSSDSRGSADSRGGATKTARSAAIMPHDGVRGKSFLSVTIKTMGSQGRRR